MRDLRVTTFVVRVTRDPEGALSAIVERVSDGLKERLPGDLDTVGAVIRRLLPAFTPREPTVPPCPDTDDEE